ncbi:MAG: dihydropteroate synthase [Actinobacteria bacterium]|nr:dihydropteroate synthase [Actinomycetota bacterium]
MEPQTIVMGILNITPDSFADGGKHFSLGDAVSRAEQMITEGVDIIDVGGESTRPGAERVSEAEESRRVMPVIKEIRKFGVPISIDTMRSGIAREAISLGVRYVNDVSGGLADSGMPSLIAQSGIKYIVMHWRAHSAEMMSQANYEDVVGQVYSELEFRLEQLGEAGVKRDQMIIDPGIGFSKSAEHNWQLLREIDGFFQIGLPILIGASRKRFLGQHLAPEERESASVAITSYCATQGVWAVRTHSVKPHKDAIAKVARIQGALNG